MVTTYSITLPYKVSFTPEDIEQGRSPEGWAHAVTEMLLDFGLLFEEEDEVLAPIIEREF